MFRRVTSFLRKRSVEKELDDELRASLDALAEEHIRNGASPQDAMRLARIELGGVEQVKEEVRSVRGLPVLDSAIKDFRHAGRNLLRSPGFSISVVVTLGLALGANAAVLGLLDKLILRPLPVKEPGGLVALSAPALPHRIPSRATRKGGRYSIFRKSNNRNPAAKFSMSYPLYTELRDRVQGFAGVLAQMTTKATIVAGGTPVAAAGVLVTGNYFDLLGVKPAIGRLLTPGDDGPDGGSPVVVLTHGFWQRQFGSDPSVLNQTIRLNKVPMTVVGVAAHGFAGTAAGESLDFFAPVCMVGSFMRLGPERAPPRIDVEPLRFDSPNLHVYDLIARLAPGTDVAQAERAGDLVYQQLLSEVGYFDPGAIFDTKGPFKGGPDGYHLRLLPAGYASSQQSALSRDLRTPLLLLMAMVGMLLVIATGNVANLFLARGEARSREIAIRFALGASRWRVLRALLVESLLLTLTAGSLGLLVSRWATALVPVILHVEKLPDGVSTVPDSRIGLAVMVLSLVVGFCIWAASLPRAMGRAALLANTAQTTGSARHTLRWRRALVVAQTALSIVLLCASAVLSRSLIRLMHVDPGFSVEDRYSFWLDPRRAGYTGARSSSLVAQVLERLSEMPGVKGVSMATALPLSAEGGGGFVSSDADVDANVGTSYTYQSPGHFANLGIAVMSGREFTRDDGSGPKVAVINEALARKLFGKSDPIGRRIGDGQPQWPVVGVVRDIKPGARIPSTAALYLPYTAQDRESPRAGFLVRTENDVRLTSEMVRAMVHSIEPGVAIEKFGSLAGQAAQSLYPDRMMASVSLCFAGFAAFLCAIGIFGLTSYGVTKRAQEIGVRIVLGATRTSIQWLVLKEVSLMAAAGCVIGLAAFLLAGGVLSTVIFGLTPSDPASLTIGVAVLGGTAFLAGCLPAYRATIVDPASTLRQE
jgi:predicted permease